MNLSIKTHIDPNGVLHIEGLDQIADQDVTVTVSLPATFVSPIEFDLEQYAAPTVGSEVAASNYGHQCRLCQSAYFGRAQRRRNLGIQRYWAT